MNIPAAVLLVTLAVIGAASVVRAICLRLFCAKDDGMVMYITHIPADCGNAEFILRSALVKRGVVRRQKRQRRMRGLSDGRKNQADLRRYLPRIRRKKPDEQGRIYKIT